jgi:hypothetical protein
MMDLGQQQDIIQYFWLKGWETKCITNELKKMLKDDAYWETQTKFWIARFKDSDLSCDD